jgi:hypothetical protein
MLLSSFLTWFADNFLYYVLILVSLFVWDVIDFYIQTNAFHFVLKKPYLFYFWTRAFLSITVMELTISLGLLSVQNKVVISFVTPLIFSTMLQNLVVKVGGEGKTQLDISELFQNFRYRVIDSLVQDDIAKKVAIWTKIVDSAIPTEKIEKACREYAPSIDAFNTIQKSLSEYPEERKRVEYMKQLIEWMGMEFVDELFKKV